MKITKSKLKEIISEEISNLTEFGRPEENIPGPPEKKLAADTARVDKSIDSVGLLKSALGKIDTVGEFIELFSTFVSKLNPETMTVQEFDAAMRKIVIDWRKDKVKPGM